VLAMSVAHPDALVVGPELAFYRAVESLRECDFGRRWVGRAAAPPLFLRGGSPSAHQPSDARAEAHCRRRDWRPRWGETYYMVTGLDVPPVSLKHITEPLMRIEIHVVDACALVEAHRALARVGRAATPTEWHEALMESSRDVSGAWPKYLAGSRGGEHARAMRWLRRYIIALSRQLARAHRIVGRW